MSMDEGTDLLRDARKVVLKTIEGSTAEERGDWERNAGKNPRST